MRCTAHPFAHRLEARAAAARPCAKAAATYCRRPRRAHRAGRAGFTLVELLIAMAAGLLVSLAAFILAKGATRVFQHEARISGAHIAAMQGLNRLAGDLQRAAFMSSPNIQKDPAFCGSLATLPAPLGTLAGIRIEQDGSAALYPAELAQSTNAANDFHPDRIIIGGNFATTEQFAVRAIVPGIGGGLAIWLQTDSAPYQRTFRAGQQGGADLSAIFAQGRYLRLVDLMGRHEYGVIQGINTAGGNAVVQLQNTPTPQQKTPANTCGYGGLGVGVLVNPVYRIVYEVRSLAGNATFGTLVTPEAQSAAVSGEAGRTELIRYELGNDNAAIANTLELIAEYAVDLEFGITTTNAGPDATALVRMPIARPANANVYLVAGNVMGGSTPERIRAVQVRLSTRAKLGDRTADVGQNDATSIGPDGRKLRFLISSDIPQPRYARLRTLYADVALPNLAGISW